LFYYIIMPKSKKIRRKRVIRKKQTQKRKYKRARNRTKRGGGFFDTIKKSIGIGNKEASTSDLVLDETSVKNKIEKKINLNTKLNYITEHFSYIIKKYWNKFLNKEMDDIVIKKLISGVYGMGYYEEEKVEKLIATFGRKTEIEKQDIRTCIKLYLFLDNIYELNDISASFITQPQDSGTLKTDIWDVLKELVKEVSSEINFDETYKQDREKQLNRLLDEYRKNVAIYNSDRLPEPVVNTSLTPPPLTPAPSASPPPPSASTQPPSASPRPPSASHSVQPPAAAPIPRNNRSPIPRNNRSPIPRNNRSPIPRNNRSPIPRNNRSPIPRNNRLPTPSPTPEARSKFSFPKVVLPSLRNNKTINSPSHPPPTFLPAPPNTLGSKPPVSKL
jgi:hypothetical protein